MIPLKYLFFTIYCCVLFIILGSPVQTRSLIVSEHVLFQQFRHFPSRLVTFTSREQTLETLAGEFNPNNQGDKISLLIIFSKVALVTGTGKERCSKF